VPAFIRDAHAAALTVVPGARPLPFGHLGDGNIHFNVIQPEGADKAEFLKHWDAMNAAVFAVVKKYGGSISAEHGVGVVKRDLLPSVKDPVALELMHGLKHLLDPNNILNPGKVLRVR
jgi:FAD/FMN-containing dehydrogenase